MGEMQCKCLLSILCLTIVSAELIETAGKDGQCDGTVTLYEGPKETLVKDSENVKVNIDRVKVEGCGCFRLYAKKNGRGKSYLLWKRGEHSSEEVGCESRAMPLWMVVLIVLGVVLVTAVVAVLVFRTYRKYKRVKTEEGDTEA